MGHGTDISWRGNSIFTQSIKWEFNSLEKLFETHCSDLTPSFAIVGDWAENHLTPTNWWSCTAQECGLLPWPRWFSNRHPSNFRTLGLKDFKILALTDHTLRISALRIGLMPKSYLRNQHLSLVWTKNFYQTHFLIISIPLCEVTVASQVGYSWPWMKNSLYSCELSSS